MGNKEVIARVKAKRQERYEQQQADRAAKAARRKPATGDGNVFTDDDIDVMERANERRVADSG